jgi:gamma-glutamyltranspeptidase / glutathione hydrolase
MTAAVAAGSSLTARAAVQVLEAGGNAFDATIAAGFAAAVTEPCLTSLAGGGFLLAHTAPGDQVLYDFFVSVPGLDRPAHRPSPAMHDLEVQFGQATQVFHVGPGSVAVPGVLQGYVQVHQRLGRLPLANVVAPAIRFAEEGFAVGRALADLVGLLDPALSLTDEGRSLFHHHGRPLQVGDRFTNPQLGQFLRQVGAGPRHGFEPHELGGGVTDADLAQHRLIEREPLRFMFRGVEVVTNPPPSLGGHLVAHGAAHLDGLGGVGDVDPLMLADALRSMAQERRRLAAGAVRGTTHVSVADAEGNVAAMTTSNGSGSGVFAPSTGIQLNNMLGEDDLLPGGSDRHPPGTRVPSMMAPTFVVRPDRSLVALGSGGSERIRSTVLQLVVALAVSSDCSLHHVVTAPRLHWDGQVLQVEPGLPPGTVDALRRLGPVNEWPAPDLYFGGAHCVSSDGEAAGDPRRQGVGLVVDP